MSCETGYRDFERRSGEEGAVDARRPGSGREDEAGAGNGVLFRS